jgi:hypothetical protein
MDFITALLSLVQSWGPSAITAVLVLVVTHLGRGLDKNSKADDARFKELRDHIAKSIDALRVEMTKQIENTIRRVDEQARDIAYIKVEYVKKADYFQDNSGWRTDINRIFDQLIHLSEQIGKKEREQ